MSIDLKVKFTFGDVVIIDDGDIHGVVTAIMWRTEEATIEVSYFHNGDQKTVWVPQWRLTHGD